MFKILATIEARMGSSRLPGKVLLPMAGASALSRMVERASRAKSVSRVCVATTTSEADDVIAKEGEREAFDIFRGSEDDVLDRVLKCAIANNADIIVELTADCPLIDPAFIDSGVEYFLNRKLDYYYNRLQPGLPDGFDIQIFWTSKLAEVASLTNDPIDRVHVSWFFRRNPDCYKIGGENYPASSIYFWPELALTLDQREDYELIGAIFDHFYSAGNEEFDTGDVLQFLRVRPELVELVKNVRRKFPEDG